MLDMNMFREHADVIRADHTKRGLPHDNIDKGLNLTSAGGTSCTKPTSFAGPRTRRLAALAQPRKPATTRRQKPFSPRWPTSGPK